VAINKAGDTYLARMGQQQWLVSPRSPEEVWPLVRQFFLDRNFKFQKEDAASGVLETDWVENRANLPKDLIRSTIGQVLDACTTAACDRFTIRVLRGADGKGRDLHRPPRPRRGLHQPRWQHHLDQPAGRPGAGNRTADPPDAGPLAGGHRRQRRQRCGLRRPGRWCRWPPRPACSAASRVPRWKWTTAWNAPGAVSAWRWTAPASRWRRDRALATYAVRYVDPKIAARIRPISSPSCSAPRNRRNWPWAATGSCSRRWATSTQITVQKPNGDPDNSESAQRIAQQLVDELKY
jgi:outer membrane protein assembly factor BamC